LAVVDAREALTLTLLRIVLTLHLDRMLSMTGSLHAFTDYFKGLERVQTVREIFGDQVEEVLRGVKVEFTWFGGYMSVNGRNGHLMISSRYLNSGDKVDIYLDLIHELVHVKQFMLGKELFDVHYSYTERPTEVEAYRYAVKEARRLGLTDERICQYLKTEWMSEKDLERLARAVQVRCPSSRVCLHDQKIEISP
jgi:hypothetical protein